MYEKEAVKEEFKDRYLDCALNKRRYIVLYYCGPNMVTHLRQIIKFCTDTGRGVICHDDADENNVGKTKKVVLAKDMDSRENVFVKYNTAKKYILSGDMICPSSGAFEAYSVGLSKYGNYVLVNIRIPQGAARLSVFMERICRCNCAEVLSITSLDGSQNFKKCKDVLDMGLKYKVGKVTKVKAFDSDRRRIGEGVMFFMSKEEALEYVGR